MKRICHFQAGPISKIIKLTLFFLKDGSVAWEAKDFLIEQEQCEEVTIEQKVYHGKHTEAYKKEEKEAPKAKNNKKKSKSTRRKKNTSEKEDQTVFVGIHSRLVSFFILDVHNII